MTKHVYFFGGGKADGHGKMKDILGGKGAGLAEMTNLGMPVPPGFTIDTVSCVHYFKTGDHVDGLHEEVGQKLAQLEELMGQKFGDASNPLLVSVRSGARVSMPGMMDTVLNLGLNDETVQGLMDAGERFAWDSYRRFIQMYSDVVLGIDFRRFEHCLAELRTLRGAASDTELSAEDLKGLVDTYKGIVLEASGKPFPTDPHAQLWGAIDAVFGSWNNHHAIEYRRLHGISDDWGTGVNVQTMVFGNMGDDCATGVAFTRDPATGEQRFFGEYLVNAQGEDVVAGIRTPLPINGEASNTLQSIMPELYNELNELRLRLETHYRDMQDVEFTIQQGTLYMLQTRTGKRTAASAVKIAVDMTNEGLIDKRTAVSRVEPEQIETLLHRRIDPKAAKEVLATGLGASPGAAVGQLVFTADDAVAWTQEGKKVVLMRPETSPEDIAGMGVAEGVITARGGATSHAAVVARGMGKTCVAGCGALNIDEEKKTVSIGDVVLNEGDVITIEGTDGEVIRGAVALIDPEMGPEFTSLMSWADEIRRLGVRTNADTPHDCEVALGFGAEGIGLTRTEHMFFDEERIQAVREMILSKNVEERRIALAKLKPYQQADFEGIFRVMDGLPCTIRLLDPPLHEFLPHHREDLKPIADELNISVDALEDRVESLVESNPMLGHRGCRLAITYPEIAEMQTEAIVSAACTLVKEGLTPKPEIMIPLVGLADELRILREVVCRVADRVIEEAGVELDY
ncbi:MAG: pyruvate, phosphate dikinase, partial [Proteobacteria bacterium]|nr:pyruvate, phosphate dikinase [Pseudomonadota bacterium]